MLVYSERQLRERNTLQEVPELHMPSLTVIRSGRSRHLPRGLDILAASLQIPIEIGVVYPPTS